MDGTLQHTEPLTAVVYTGRKPHQAKTTIVSLMADPADENEYAVPVALHPVCHN